MSTELYILNKNTKSRIEISLSNEAQTILMNDLFCSSSYIYIPSGIIVTIEKDNANPFDLERNSKNNIEHSKYIYQNSYHSNYFTARIVKFDFDEKNLDSKLFLEFKYYYSFFNFFYKLKKLHSYSFGEIYITICIDDYQKI